jgi:hypothetical protein
MNASGLACKVGVERTRDDALVIRLLTMQSEEVPAIQGEYGALLGACPSQELGIGHSGTQQALDERYHVMTMRSQLLHHRKRHVLIGQQPRHNSGRLVLDDLVLDLFAVAPHVGPRVCEILGAQRGI